MGRFHFIFNSVLSSILRRRAVALVITALVSAQVVLGSLHFPGWTCPMFAATGYPCPGCGLTRAVVALLHLDFRAMAQLHIFAPFALLAAFLAVLAALLPTAMRNRLISAVESVERTTGVTTLVLLALVVYWVTRICFYRSSLSLMLAF